MLDSTPAPAPEPEEEEYEPEPDPSWGPEKRSCVEWSPGAQMWLVRIRSGSKVSRFAPCIVSEIAHFIQV